MPEVLEGRAAFQFFGALAGGTILIKCLDDFYPKYRSCEVLCYPIKYLTFKPELTFTKIKFRFKFIQNSSFFN